MDRDLAMAFDPWRLDPAKFPQRLDLALTDEFYEVLVATSERTRRSVSEVAVEMLAREMDLHPLFLGAESQLMG